MVSLPSNLGFLFLSRCLIFKVQSLSSKTLSRRQLKEYIILFFVCQYFFESFFNFFASTFLLCFRSLASARIYYHFAQEMSRVFGHFFESFRPLIRVFVNRFKVVWFRALSGTIYGLSSQKKTAEDFSPADYIYYIL